MNMKKTLLIGALAFVLSACVKPTESIRFSILGDSFSAMEGTVYPDSNDVWYVHEPTISTDVTLTEQMWWYKVATETGWTLDRNNSFSGSLICNFWGYNAGPYYGPHSFLRRMDDLGNPDVIFVFGGTNDVHNGAYCGDYVYSEWTEGQLECYRPALACLFDNLKQNYPKAKTYFLVDMWLYDYDANGERFVESVQRIARRCDVECIELYGIERMYGHPNKSGQAAIAGQVIEALSADFSF